MGSCYVRRTVLAGCLFSIVGQIQTPPGHGKNVLSRLPHGQKETFNHSVLHYLVHSQKQAEQGPVLALMTFLF